MSLGKLTHYAIDLVLISVILAGIHRNTGLQFDTNNFSLLDIRRWFGKYLSFGEVCYEKIVKLLRVSGYFKQTSILDRLKESANDDLDRNLGDNKQR
ncbi:hypothetical protein Cantr_08099 [Candida viswanathii]|uniref:DUF1748-domain-containing protein n=1 Tax=Candida viswanathii TaxID=5486 RepID=A0A367Y7A2_9ASCO|nr:hypothetical protein Cantr_08099 [Candida viswanathii]